MKFNKFKSSQKLKFDGRVKKAYATTLTLASNDYFIDSDNKNVSILYGVKWFNFKTFSLDFAAIGFGRANASEDLALFCYWRENGVNRKRFLCFYKDFSKYEFDMKIEPDKILFAVNNPVSHYYKDCFVRLEGCIGKFTARFSPSWIMKPMLHDTFAFKGVGLNGVYLTK